MQFQLKKYVWVVDFQTTTYHCWFHDFFRFSKNLTFCNTFSYWRQLSCRDASFSRTKKSVFCFRCVSSFSVYLIIIEDFLISLALLKFDCILIWGLCITSIPASTSAYVMRTGDLQQSISFRQSAEKNLELETNKKRSTIQIVAKVKKGTNI